MAQTGSLAGSTSSRAAVPGSVGFDWIMVLLSLWIVLGAHVDAWAHINFPQLETFFTPWHALLYSGLAAMALFIGGTAVRNHGAGYSWERSLPDGYWLSLVGVVVFGASGVGDLIWHAIFGIEANLDALISPTHLLLATGAALIVSGPMRATRSRTGGRWMDQAPMVLSLTMVIALLAYMTQFAHPFGFVWAISSARPMSGLDPFPAQAVGLLGVMLQAAIWMGPILLTVRRRTLPVGSLTLVFGLTAVLMAFTRAKVLVTGPYLLIGVAILAGASADLLYGLLRPAQDRPAAFRAFAFVVPIVLYTLYFVALVVTRDVWWSVHLINGTILLAGFVGLLLSYLVLPSGP